MLALILFAVAWLSGGPALAASVVAVALDRGHIVLRFDAPIERASSSVLADGRRILVDLPGVEPGAVDRAALRRRSPYAAFAAIHAEAMPGGTRLAFDLTEAASVSDGLLDGDGRALTLSLTPATGATQANLAGTLDFFPLTLDLGRSRARYTVVQAVPPAAKAPPLPRIAGDRSRPLVVIDPGHGGIDPGAINPETGLREKDVTLKIARAIRDELVAGGRVRVALTRDDDRYLVLRERYGIARRLKANLFISIHCDSVGSGDATGASAYTLSEVASDKEAARLAARENKADVIAGLNLGDAGADVSSILIDLTQRETMNSSANFARLLGREAKPLIPTKAVFHRMASLMVLKAPDLPSILFETGYISNPVDAAFLDSREGRERIAESVTKAVEVHFARQLAGR